LLQRSAVAQRQSIRLLTDRS